LSSRDAILARIRAARGGRGASSQQEVAGVHAHLAAHPQGPRPYSDWDPIERLRERAQSLTTTLEQIADIASLPQAVARYLGENKLPLQAVCWPEFGTLGWRAAGINVETRSATGDDLIGITAAFCVIAETGTLMLLSGEVTPGTTSLLTETHIAVVPVSRIVRGMEDAWALLRAEHGATAMPRAVNFISGPSRTADIEQTLVLGAHGPYRVHIILTGV
jgi:L-lactate dehydrogenase complex protein LldG